MSISIYYEKLKDRDLWVDGQSSLSVDSICHKILSGEDVSSIIESNPISGRDRKEVEKFLKLVPELNKCSVKFKEKSSVAGLDTSLIPDYNFNSDIEKTILKKFKKQIKEKNMSEEETLMRLERIGVELDLFKERGLFDMLSACYVVVDILRKNNIVWGPGRGSACCSYVLYLIGIHDIDSVQFDLDIHEFLR